MTQVSYGGIELLDVLTQDVNQETVYDTAGQVDQIYVKTTVTVRFLFHAGDGTGLGVKVGANLAGGTKAALDVLNTPRQRFTMSVGGNTLFDVVPGAVGVGETAVVVSSNSTIDVNNGPRPKVTIQEIIGTQVVHGTFTVEIAVPSCGTPATVTNLRWWTVDDIGVNWYTTRTINGIARIASKSPDFGPHSVRGLIFPPLQDGFRRESMTFTESPNGLELAFAIKDKEIYRSAPFPASTARGKHRMSSQVPGATVVESECSVQLTGAHDVPQTALITLGVKIIDNKLQLANQGVGSSGKAKAMLMFYAIETDLFENEVSVMARIKHTGQGEDGFEFLPQASPQLGKSLPSDIAVGGESYNPNQSRLLPGPTAPLTTIIQSALQTPCHPATLPGATRAQSGGESTPEKETDITYLESENPLPADSDAGPPYSDGQRDAPYTLYSLSIQNLRVQGKAPMAYGTASSSSQPSSTVIDTANPTTKRVFHLKATRIGQAPELLNPRESFVDEKGIEHVLLKDGVGTPVTTVTDGGGIQLFTTIQLLSYHLIDDPDIRENGMEVPLAPWVKPGAVASPIPPGILTTDPAGGI